MSQIKKILVIQTSFIGDAILATSILESLHKNLPEASIHILVRKGNETLFANHPFLKKVWIWDKQRSKYAELFRLIKAIRREGFDAVINAHRFMSSGLITALSKASFKSGFNKNPASFLFSHVTKHTFDGQHEIDRNHQLILPIAESTKPEKPKLYPSQEDESLIAKYRGEKYFCLFPGSQWFTKQWPEEKWSDLISNLPEDAMVYLLGGSGDQDICDRIKFRAKNHAQVKVLAGKLSLLQSAALMKNAQVNFTNDSSPTHLASSMNAVTKVVFCSTVPSFGFGPLSDNSTTVETKLDLECRPCGLHGHKACPKGHFKCATSIKVEEVI